MEHNNQFLATERIGALTAAYLLFPRQIIGIFGAANESAYYTQFAVRAFRTYLCMMIFACVNKACFIFHQSMGKAAASTALSMIREVLFGVGFALLLPLWFGLDGVLYSMPVSDLLTFLVAIFLIAGTYKELNKRCIDRGSAMPELLRRFAPAPLEKGNL